MRWTSGMHAETEARVLADAHLIAAAPEMHALLVMLARAEEPMDVAELRGMAAQLLTKIDGGHS
jgi:hypothetical protein